MPLVYVTDGTMINWLREGRLSRIGTVIGQAHERSVNIDFTMGYPKRELDRYSAPAGDHHLGHLRCAQFYQRPLAALRSRT